MSTGVYDGHHRMPENEEAVIRSLFRLRSHDPIPEKFAKLYWLQRHQQSKLGIGVIRDDILCLLANMSGCAAEAPPPPSIFDLHRDGKIKKNAAVSYVWRNEKQVGRLVSVDTPRRKAIVAGSDGVSVEVAGDTVSPVNEELQPA